MKLRKTLVKAIVNSKTANLCPSARKEKQNSGLITTKPGCLIDLRLTGDSPVTQSSKRRVEVVVTRHNLPSGEKEMEETGEGVEWRVARDGILDPFCDIT